MKGDFCENIDRSNTINNLINIGNSSSGDDHKQLLPNKMSLIEEKKLAHKVNLAAAFHDHISCTKLPSQICKVGGDINSLISASLNSCSSIDSSNSILFGASTTVSEDKQQIQRSVHFIINVKFVKLIIFLKH